MDTRNKAVLKLSAGIGIFIAALVYIWFVIMRNNYTEGLSVAFFFGVFASVASYIAIQTSTPKDYPISQLTKKIVITVFIFFGAWFSSVFIMVSYLDFVDGVGTILGLILAVWAAQYYAYGRQARLKKAEKQAKAKVAAEEAKIAKEAEKKEREAQEIERRKVWLAELDNDLA